MHRCLSRNKSVLVTNHAKIIYYCDGLIKLYYNIVGKLYSPDILATGRPSLKGIKYYLALIIGIYRLWILF
jgi:hypothetical protein